MKHLPKRMYTECKIKDMGHLLKRIKDMEHSPNKCVRNTYNQMNLLES